MEIQQFLQRLPREIVAGFSETQVAALADALRDQAATKKHRFDRRMRFRFGNKRAYLVILAGPEGRPQGRREYETSPVEQALIIFLALALFALQGLLFVGAY